MFSLTFVLLIVTLRKLTSLSLPVPDLLGFESYVVSKVFLLLTGSFGQIFDTKSEQPRVESILPKNEG